MNTTDTEALPPLLTDEQIAYCIYEARMESGTFKRDGTMSYRIARAVEREVRAALAQRQQVPDAQKARAALIHALFYLQQSQPCIAAECKAEQAEWKQEALDAIEAALTATPQAAEPVAQHFGIIDPDYARIYTQARIIAWQYGFACLAHGSFTRDLDLLLVPWTDAAQADDVDYFAPRIAEAAGLKVSPHPASDRPHRRKTWTLLLPGFAEPRWVDLSVLSPTAPQAQPQAAQAQPQAAQAQPQEGGR